MLCDSIYISSVSIISLKLGNSPPLRRCVFVARERLKEREEDLVSQLLAGWLSVCLSVSVCIRAREP
jgi:hypothetical protein